MIGLLIQRFQRYEQEKGANGPIKNFMAQQIQILKRSIQRSEIKEQQLISIAGCQTIKNHMYRSEFNKKFQNMRYLTMNSNPITNKGLYYLAKAPWTQIRIRMQNCPITVSGLKVMFKIVSLKQFYFFQGELGNYKKCIKFQNSFKEKYFLSLISRQLEKI